jgi:hypothetical protein
MIRDAGQSIELSCIGPLLRHRYSCSHLSAPQLQPLQASLCHEAQGKTKAERWSLDIWHVQLMVAEIRESNSAVVR